MRTDESVIKVIFAAVDELNQLLPKDHQLEKSLDTALSGNSAKSDSLALANLIVAMEQKIEEEFNVTITLADESVMSQENNPFHTIGTLVDYISLRFEEKRNG